MPFHACSARLLPLRRLLPCALALLVPAVALRADIIDVPGDAPTIQQGIALAQPGDEVVVAAGSWPGLIDFLGKAITVRSADGPATTTIDGQFSGPVVTFASGEGASSVLEGFTIRNGLIQSIDIDAGGGGIFISAASPVIRDCEIRNNISTWNGAGIFCVDSNARFEGNLIMSNSFQAFIADAPYGSGAGLHVRGGAVTLVDNVLAANEGADRGGGIFFEDTLGSTATSTVCIGNSSGLGGAIAIDGASSVSLENVLVAANSASGLVSFIGTSEGLGGGIWVAETSTAVIRGATILWNNTFPGYDGPGSGGGIHAATTVPTTLENSIVRENSAGSASQVHPSVSVTYTNLQGGAPGLGNIDADPLFAAGPGGGFYLSQLAAGQTTQSPCVDAGNPLSSPVSTTTTRTDEASDTGIIDMGYHFPTGDVPFRRGDANGDQATNIADAVFLLSVLFPVPPGPAPTIGCADAADANDDGSVNIADAIAILGALFGGTPLPPPTGACGNDPTPDPLTCDTPPTC